MTLPTMTPVKSSNIEEVGHDGEALFLRFRSAKPGVPGRVYRYPTAGADLHAEVLAHSSPGTWFRERVKDAHVGEHIPGV